MSNPIIIAIVVVILIKVGVFAWFYLFNIYETIVLVSPKLLTTSIYSKIGIKVVPLNSFGRRALLRKISAKFEIISGDSLIKIVEMIPDRMTLKSLGKIGKIEILITPIIGLFPSKIEIEIVSKE